MKIFYTYFIGLFSLLLFFIPCSTAGNGVDHSIFASLLKNHVTANHVNYDGFKKDEKLLDTYLEVLNRIDTKSLSKNEKFAFYINAYNAFTIKLVLTKYPGINSIKEIGGFFSNPWKQKIVYLQGKALSLDHIEHRILRPVFKDPRVHFAINCASKSCPPLRDEPYEGSSLEIQLDEQAKIFINDRKYNFIKKNTLFLSKIFKWFEDDFSDNPVIFIKQYADAELQKMLHSIEGKRKIEYLEYDWSLNR